jgi:threonine dehydratase
MGVTETTLEAPTLDDVRAAAERIAPHLRPTPLEAYPALSELIGADVWIKHENRLPTGAFKVRGGINLVSQLDEDERRRGLISASTGNHGQSVAYAAQLFGVRATICVPEGANQLKVDSMRKLGAEIVVHGRDFDDAREHCEELAERHGHRYVHSGDEPQLIAGVGTATLEILAAEPEIDTLVVPIGGGSGAAGACIAGKGVKRGLEVLGVQSDAAPAAYRSWREGRVVEDRMETFAEGLATRIGFGLPQRVIRAQLDDFVLVSDDAIRAAMVLLLEHTRQLVEAAGAAALAGALELRPRLAGRRVALICTGGNITLEQLRALLAWAA